uniref:Uncharacterized protein n=1 Tax=Globodera rostochiensis TaxID=31243 RepID=A0A914HXX9_GLORO
MLIELKKVFLKYILSFFVLQTLCVDQNEKEVGQILLDLKKGDANAFGEVQQKFKAISIGQSAEEKPKKQQNDDVINNGGRLKGQKESPTNKVKQNVPSNSASAVHSFPANESHNKIRFVSNFFGAPIDCNAFDEIAIKSVHKSMAGECSQSANFEANSRMPQIFERPKRAEENEINKQNSSSTQIKMKVPKDTNHLSTQKIDQTVQRPTQIVKTLLYKKATKVDRMVQKFVFQRLARWKFIDKIIRESCASVESVLHHFKGTERRKMAEEIGANKSALLLAGRSVDSALISIELLLLPFAADLSTNFDQIFFTEKIHFVSEAMAKQMLCLLIEPISVKILLNVYIEILQKRLPDDILLVFLNNSSMKAKEYMRRVKLYLATITESCNARSNLNIYYQMYKVVSKVLDNVGTEFDQSIGMANVLYKTKAFVNFVLGAIKEFLRKASEIGFERIKSENCKGKA